MSRRCGIRVPSRMGVAWIGCELRPDPLAVVVVGNSPFGRELLDDRQSTSAALVGFAPTGMVAEASTADTMTRCPIR